MTERQYWVNRALERMTEPSPLYEYMVRARQQGKSIEQAQAEAEMKELITTGRVLRKNKVVKHDGKVAFISVNPSPGTVWIKPSEVPQNEGKWKLVSTPSLSGADWVNEYVNGSKIEFLGVDMARGSDVSAECVLESTADGGLRMVSMTVCKPRREPTEDDKAVHRAISVRSDPTKFRQMGAFPFMCDPE